MNSDKIISINANGFAQSTAGGDIYETRENFNNAFTNADTPQVSVIIVSVNRLDKTRDCIESLLANTKDVNYELILVDNGSDDGTLEYFKSVDFTPKTIIAISKNMGLGFAVKQVMPIYQGEYFCLLSNDLVLTKNWLSNLLICINSDNKIGLVNPRSTNVSNHQNIPGFEFTTIENFMQKAERFNVSDPSKWEQSLRVITLGALFRRSALDIVGTFDVGFVHDFSEDDMCARIRRAGYKIFLCGDVMIHHNHNFSQLTQEEESIYLKRMAQGRDVFAKKYYGLDAWTSMFCSFRDGIITLRPQKNKTLEILGIDVKMGLPILEISNFLRQNNIFDFTLNAFTQKAKYYLDLQTICGENVVCDRIEFIDEYYNEKSFDYILFGEDINSYSISQELLECFQSMLKPDGILMYNVKVNDDLEVKIIKKQ